MPKGVEHKTNAADIETAVQSEESVMPKGVEHVVARPVTVQIVV